MYFKSQLKYKAANYRLILLDYDGTLVDFVSFPDNAIPSNFLLKILSKLSIKPNTKVVIVTGRKSQSIDKLIGNLSIDIVAEHGAMIKENGQWYHLAKINTVWKNLIFPVFNRILAECPESFIEEKHFSLAWHYRDVNPMLGHLFSRELIAVSQKISNYYNLRIIDGNKVVEIMDADINKGKIVTYLLKQANYDYIVAIGDDKTDEDMFSVLSGVENSMTIKVGDGDTMAKHTLKNVEQVIELLEQIAK